MDRPAMSGVSTVLDGMPVIAAAEDRAIHVWNGLTGQRIATLQGHSLKIKGIAAHPSEPILLSCSDDKTVRLWDLRSATRTDGGADAADGAYWVSDIAIAPDGFAITGGWDGAIRRWELRDGGPLAAPVNLARNDNRIDAVALLPGTRVCITGDTAGWLCGWDVDTGARLFAHRVQDKAIMAVRTSRDGSKVAASGWDSSVMVWDAADLLAGRATERVRLPDDGPCDDLRITPDDRLLIRVFD